MRTLTCARCGTTQEFAQRTEETLGKKAAEDGWLLWLPHGKAWCPTCHHTPHQRRTVQP